MCATHQGLSLWILVRVVPTPTNSLVSVSPIRVERVDPDTIQALELGRDVGGEGHWALLLLVDEQFVHLLRELQIKRKILK
jgi:hypothetical protein